MCAGDATRIGRTLASRLKELLDRQQYEVIIQVRLLYAGNGEFGA